MFSASCKVGFATEKELFETPGGWVEQGECVHAICTSNRTDQSKYIFVLHVCTVHFTQLLSSKYIPRLLGL